jgi:hypothetical protein
LSANAAVEDMLPHAGAGSKPKPGKERRSMFTASYDEDELASHTESSEEKGALGGVVA